MNVAIRTTLRWPTWWPSRARVPCSRWRRWTVFAKSLHDQRRALIGFGAGTVLTVVLEAAIWPSVSSMPSLDSFLAGYPEALRKMFDLQEFGTGTGFVNAELFSALVPGLFLAFAIARGSRAITGDQEAGPLDVLLVTRVTTTSLLLQQAAALGVTLLALGGVLFLSVLGGSAAFGMGIGASGLLAATVATVGLAVEFGWLALAVGAVTGRRGVAIGVATAAAVAGYLLYVAGELVDAVQPWQALSPFDQALGGGPIGAGFRLTYLAMPLAGAVLLALALPVVARRDIAVPH